MATWDQNYPSPEPPCPPGLLPDPRPPSPLDYPFVVPLLWHLCRPLREGRWAEGTAGAVGGGEKAVCLQDALRKAEPLLGTNHCLPLRGEQNFPQGCWTTGGSRHGAPHGPCRARRWGESVCRACWSRSPPDPVCGDCCSVPPGGPQPLHNGDQRSLLSPPVPPCPSPLREVSPVSTGHFPRVPRSRPPETSLLTPQWTVS